MLPSRRDWLQQLARMSIALAEQENHGHAVAIQSMQFRVAHTSSLHRALGNAAILDAVFRQPAIQSRVAPDSAAPPAEEAPPPRVLTRQPSRRAAAPIAAVSNAEPLVMELPAADDPRGAEASGAIAVLSATISPTPQQREFTLDLTLITARAAVAKLVMGARNQISDVGERCRQALCERHEEGQRQISQAADEAAEAAQRAGDDAGTYLAEKLAAMAELVRASAPEVGSVAEYAARPFESWTRVTHLYVARGVKNPVAPLRWLAVDAHASLAATIERAKQTIDTSNQTAGALVDQLELDANKRLDEVEAGALGRSEVDSSAVIDALVEELTRPLEQVVDVVTADAREVLADSENAAAQIDRQLQASIDEFRDAHAEQIRDVQDRLLARMQGQFDAASAAIRQALKNAQRAAAHPILDAFLNCVLMLAGLAVGLLATVAVGAAVVIALLGLQIGLRATSIPFQIARAIALGVTVGSIMALVTSWLMSARRRRIARFEPPAPLAIELLRMLSDSFGVSDLHRGMTDPTVSSFTAGRTLARGLTPALLIVSVLLATTAPAARTLLSRLL